MLCAYDPIDAAWRDRYTQSPLAFLRLNNTGHEGNLSTLHANNSEDAINALITNVMLRRNVSDRAASRNHIRTAIDYIRAC